MGIDRRRMIGGYLPLRDAIDQLFEGSFITPQIFGGQGGFPQVDIHTTDDDVVIEVAVPGAKPEDINISVTGDTLTISGEIQRQQRSERQPFAEEIWRGRFQRAFQLPIQVDANRADAGFENGILTVRLPKSEATKPRKIQVRQGREPIDQGSGSSGQDKLQQESVPIQSGESS